MSGLFDLDPIAPAAKPLRLERREYAAFQRVGASARHTAQLEKLEDRVVGDLVYKLTAEVLAERLPPVGVAESRFVSWGFPASSWQHFKQEHAESWRLGWLVRRRPVRYETHDKQVTLDVNLERFRQFPQADFVYPDSIGPYVSVAVVHKDWSEW